MILTYTVEQHYNQKLIHIDTLHFDDTETVGQYCGVYLTPNQMEGDWLTANWVDDIDYVVVDKNEFYDGLEAGLLNPENVTANTPDGYYLWIY